MILSKLSALLAVAACLGRASGSVSVISEFDHGSLASSLKFYTKEEIMATMTVDKAWDIVMHSKMANQHKDAVSMIRAHFESNSTVSHGLRGHKAQQPPPELEKGYAGVDKARAMLNEMMTTAMLKMENEDSRCRIFNADTLGLLQHLAISVGTFIAKAGLGRAGVLRAQGSIELSEEEAQKVRDRLDETMKKCAKEVDELKFQNKIVREDSDVVASILDIVGECDESAVSALMQCPHCHSKGAGVVMLQDARLQKMLAKLQTKAAQGYVQQNLQALYGDQAEDKEPEMLTQEEVHRQRTALLSDVAPTDAAEIKDSTDGNGTGVTEVPESNEPVDCVPTHGCKISKGSCVRIRDRFFAVFGGIQDFMAELEHDLAEKLHFCTTEQFDMMTQIGDFGTDLSQAQTELAESTSMQVESGKSAKLVGEQDGETKQEYSDEVKECCKEKNELLHEICALIVIRGQLYKLKGMEVFIKDCEVSDWEDGPCSASCDGGTTTRSRTITVHPMNGADCPPLELVESCNTQPCPVDCMVGDWESWSACTAECGGGVKSRVRPKVKASEHGGEDCAELTESQSCHSQACDADCVIGEWSNWGECTQVCWSGSERRERGIATPAIGSGSCPDANDEERLNFRPCNTQACAEYYWNSANGDYLVCGSKLDIVIVLDGSGSLGQSGWQNMKDFTNHLLRSLPGSDKGVRVAVELFSGPTSAHTLKMCSGLAGAEAPDMEKDCRIRWVSRFTNDTEGLVKKIDAIPYSEGSTLTNVALAEVESELINGREDANSVVIVVTDGVPFSKLKTREMASKLQEKARVLWVPVGSQAPVDFFHEVASLPKNENMIHIDRLKEMEETFYSNKVVATICPVINKSPGTLAIEAETAAAF